MPLAQPPRRATLARVPRVADDQQIPARFLDAALQHTGVSAIDLAERVGVAPETVSRWRRGVSVLARSQWIAICSVLSIPMTWQPPAGFKPAAPKTGRPRVKRPRR